MILLGTRKAGSENAEARDTSVETNLIWDIRATVSVIFIAVRRLTDANDVRGSLAGVV